MSEMSKYLIQFIMWPVLLSMCGYMWKDISYRVRSIEQRCIKMEMDIVRIYTKLESES